MHQVALTGPQEFFLFLWGFIALGVTALMVYAAVTADELAAGCLSAFWLAGIAVFDWWTISFIAHAIGL